MDFEKFPRKWQLLQGTDGEKLYNEMLSNKDDWDLLKIFHKLDVEEILIVGAEFDYVSPLKLHHIPMIDELINTGANLRSVIFNSGHSFSSTRIKLTNEIIDWGKKHNVLLVSVDAPKIPKIIMSKNIIYERIHGRLSGPFAPGRQHYLLE